MLEAFAAALIGTLAAQMSPGPNLVAVASVGLSNGRTRAFMVVFGVATGVLVWAALVAAGLGALLEAYPISLIILKILGGSYLAYLGIKGLIAAYHRKAVSIKTERKSISHLGSWRFGLLVVLTNPKAGLMWAAVASFLFGAGLGPLEVLLFGPIGALTAIVIYGAYALLFSSRIAVAGYSKAARWFELAFSAAFGALGGKLLIDGLRDLRS